MQLWIKKALIFLTLLGTFSPSYSQEREHGIYPSLLSAIQKCRQVMSTWGNRSWRFLTCTPHPDEKIEIHSISSALFPPLSHPPTEKNKHQKFQHVALSGLYGSPHFTQLTKILFDYPYHESTIINGIHFEKIPLENHTLLFWFLPELKRYNSISYFYLKGVQNILFHFNASLVEGTNAHTILENHFKSRVNSDPSMVLVGIGQGFIGDITPILNFKEQANIKNFICLSWAHKPFQIKYLKSKIIATLLEDEQQSQRADEEYAINIKQNLYELNKIANTLQEQPFTCKELQEALKDIDYSDLPDRLHSQVTQVFTKVPPEAWNYSQFIIAHNLFHLRHIAQEEKNLKITQWLASFPTIQDFMEKNENKSIYRRQ